MPISRSPCCATILPGTLRAVDEAVKEIGAEGCDYDENVSKISVVGLGMATQPGVAGTMFRALAEKGINIQMITTSEIKISVLVARETAPEALRAVHEAFRTARAARRCSAARQRLRQAAFRDRRRPSWSPGCNAWRKLVIDGIDLDESQSRVTFVGLPDMPGLAAQTFDELAEAGIVVDMIVQSIGRENRGQHFGDGAAEGPGKDPSRGRGTGQAIQRPAAHALPRGGQAFRVRRRHAEPYGRGRPHVPVVGPRGNQRRVDQHQRSARERGRRSRRRARRPWRRSKKEFADAMV